MGLLLIHKNMFQLYMINLKTKMGFYIFLYWRKHIWINFIYFVRIEPFIEINS